MEKSVYDSFNDCVTRFEITTLILKSLLQKSLGNYLGRCQNISYYTSANIWVLKIEIPPMPLYEEDQQNN